MTCRTGVFITLLWAVGPQKCDENPGLAYHVFSYTYAGFSTVPHKNRSIGGWRRGGYFDHAIFETVVDPALLDSAAVPAVGFLESRLEWGRLKPEDALGFHHHLGDGRHVQIDAEVGRLSHRVATGFGDPVARHTHDVWLPAGRRSHGLDQLGLSDRPLVRHVEGLAFRAGLFHGAQANAYQVLNVDELHQAMAVAGQDDGPAVAQPVPEERFAVKRILRTIDEGRTQRDHGKARILAHAEEHPLAHGFVSNIRLGMIVGRQRIAVVMVQSVAIRGHAGHEYVSRKAVSRRHHHGLRRSFHLGRGSAARPVVHVVEDHLEAGEVKRLPHRFGVVAVRH